VGNYRTEVANCLLDREDPTEGNRHEGATEDWACRVCKAIDDKNHNVLPSTFFDRIQVCKDDTDDLRVLLAHGQKKVGGK
jgi:hypothetical protein